MRTRFRTLLLAGAALLGVPAAYAAVTDGNGVPATISQVIKFVWNGNDISASNRLPVDAGGSSVTANQGTAGSSPWPVSPGTDGSASRQLRTTTTGALEPPTVAAGKMSPWFASLSANTSTQLLAANPQRIAMTIQCTGSATVAVSESGATLTTATPATGSGITVVVPGTGTLPFFFPPITSQSAVTGYTGTAQTCWGSEYLR